MATELAATNDVSRVEAPVTRKAYMMCAFAAFGGIFLYVPILVLSNDVLFTEASLVPNTDLF